MAYTILKHLQFNTWANQKFADLLLNIPDLIYLKENKSSFNSIGKTIVHIWGAQDIWLNRIHGVSTNSWLPDEFINKKEASLKGLVASSQALVKFAETKTAEQLSQSFAYKNLKGEPFESTFEDVFFHIVNHGTYHRGQIITMLREAGIEKITGTDLILFLRSLPL